MVKMVYSVKKIVFHLHFKCSAVTKILQQSGAAGARVLDR